MYNFVLHDVCCWCNVFLVIAQKSLESDYDGLKQRALGDIDEINKLLIDFW